GLAQSIYQVGGNSGQSLAPLITALVLVPFGQKGALWFTIAAFLAVCFLAYIAIWYAKNLRLQAANKKAKKKVAALKPLTKS
ncbi:hypothetical protein K4G98_27385, partial [Mycobacterium tuberculosis]|nr:hypothetical protein [Mycobacterium tuberculosis]